MISLKNEQLDVEILHPVDDQERFGVRYCTGGYIFQVTDTQHGPLMSGPTYPDSFNWFDGQGIPDAFNLSPLREPNAIDSSALVIGVGMCDLAERKVNEFCTWTIEQQPDAVRMRTSHSLGLFELELERTVALHGRTIRSTSRLKNNGRWPIPLSWFPHPFYPQTASDELCRLNIPFSMPENAGYAQTESGFISRKNWPWEYSGYYQALDLDAHSNLVIMQKHPTIGLVAATCSYVPTFFPIWGNRYTFSWEPFFERTIAPGQESTWWIDYDF